MSGISRRRSNTDAPPVPIPPSNFILLSLSPFQPVGALKLQHLDELTFVAEPILDIAQSELFRGDIQWRSEGWGLEVGILTKDAFSHSNSTACETLSSVPPSAFS